MERRQRPADSAPWDRARYGGTQANHPGIFHYEPPHYLPPHGRPYPRVPQPEDSQHSSAQQGGPPYEALRPEGGAQHRDPRTDCRQHGYPDHRAPQHGVYPHRGARDERPVMSQHQPPQHSMPQKAELCGDLSSGGPQSALLHDEEPVPHVPQHRGAQQSMAQQGGADHATQHAGDQTQFTEGHSGIFQTLRPQQNLPGISHPGGPQQNGSEYRRESQGNAPDRNSQQDLSQHGGHQPGMYHHSGSHLTSRRGPESILVQHDAHQSGMYHPDGSHNTSCRGPESSVSPHDAQQSDMYHPGGSHIISHRGPESTVSPHDAQQSDMYHPGGSHITSRRGPESTLSPHDAPQSGMYHPGGSHITSHRGPELTVSPHDALQSGMPKHGDSQSRGTHFAGPQHRGLHHDISQHKGPPQHMYQFDGSQHGTSYSDIMQHNDSQENPLQSGDHIRGMSSFGGSQAGIFNSGAPVNRPLQYDTVHCTAPSPGMVQQCSKPLQPVPTQTTPYVNNVVQGHPNFPPPFHGNLPIPSIPAPPQIGSVFSGYHKDGGLEASHLQTQVHDPQDVLNKEHFNMQREDRFENRALFNVCREDGHLHQDVRPGQVWDTYVPLERAGGQNNQPFSQIDRFYEHDGPFLPQEAPDMHRDPNYLHQHRFNEQYGGPFVPQNQPNLQFEDNLVHLNRQSDMPLEKDGAVNRDFFQQWLSSFLECQRKKPSPKPNVTQSVSITEARGLIYGALELVSQLDSLCQTLENSNEAGESRTQEYEKASDIRIELERKLKELEKPGYIQGVKKKLDRVRKKRLRWQRRKQATEEEAVEHSAEKEARIDSWRMQCIQAVEEKKRERELKAAADSVLGEVRKKKSDAKKMLDVLKSLEKLRKLRKEAAGRKGVFPPASADETFANHINRLRTMVHKRTALYDAEERALRVILEGEQEEERQRDKDKRTRKEREKVQQKQRELDSILFGDMDPLPNLNPLQPFRQYYLQAEHSVVSLVQIRHAWDPFLATPDHPDASSIPREWVLPAPPSSDIWATALRQVE